MLKAVHLASQAQSLDTKNSMRHIRIAVLFLASIAGMVMPVLAQSMQQPAENPISQLVLPAIISILSGGVTAFLATGFKLKEFRGQSQIQQEMDKKREEEKNRIQYLNPLRISAEDLKRRLEEIVDVMQDEQEKIKITNGFDYINESSIGNRKAFDKWCNIDGYFCVATLYMTSVYFSRANKLRAEFPIAQLDPDEDEKLLRLLSQVREAFGGRHGIWETIQDSIGSYTRKPDGSLMNYREYCGEIADSDKHVWFRSLIDFYVSFHKKLDYEVKEVLSALDELSSFLKEMQKRKNNGLQMSI